MAPADPANVWIIGQTAQWQEDYEYAEAVSRLIVAALRRAGVLSWLPYALSAHAEILWWTGQWTAARAAVAESATLAEETGQRGLLGFTLGCAGLVAAGLGEDAESGTCLARAADVAAATGLKPVLLYLERAHGFRDLTFDRPASAVRHLQRADELARWAGMRQPTVVAYQADLFEALLRCGDVAGAREALADLADAAARSGSRWAAATALRCQAMLDPTAGDSEQMLRRSIDQLTNVIAVPFERHRAELQLGAQLRRQRRLTEARAVLRVAADGFRRLGAPDWARRADVERHAAGDRDPDPGRGEPTAARMRQLSAQQLQVVMGVAGGATNREVAASLFLSPKTVDYHLRRACAILGVRNRTQLASLVAAAHVESGG
jgi:DNA-binding CsgD family transcriptional regulator